MDILAETYPLLGSRLPKLALAELPTPVTKHRLSLATGSYNVAVKHDEATSPLYGGNKVRKLEYLLQRAIDRGATRVATFGAVGSNHALATAMHARSIGLNCTCFLGHQRHTPKIPITLNMHRELGTEIVRFGHDVNPLPLFRRYLQNRNVWVIPAGGTCWLGSIGFVNAGLELANQIATGLIPKPMRIYMAAGTTGSVAGLALGLAAAGLESEIHAVQVADDPFGSEKKLHRLVAKMQSILVRMDPSFAADGWQDRLIWRDNFLAGGYARVDDETVNAVRLAADQLDLELETTYTGKAMAALLQDLLARRDRVGPCLFWNTFNAQPLPVSADRPATRTGIADAFLRYYEG